jgi:hypothetical protein
MEESLLLVLGPPPGEWQKELFDKYQKSKKSGEPHRSGDWESYEQEIVGKLFEHIGDAPNAIDELFRELLDSPIKITDYFFIMGMNRGLWVAHITIPRSKVLRQQGSTITWPPQKSINDTVAASLGILLKRDWIGAFALHPSTT